MIWEVDLYHTPRRADHWPGMILGSFQGLFPLPIVEENEEAVLKIG